MMYEVGVVNAIICSDSNTSMVSYSSAQCKIISLGGCFELILWFGRLAVSDGVFILAVAMSCS